MWIFLAADGLGIAFMGYALAQFLREGRRRASRERKSARTTGNVEKEGR
jgi:hypothetical protein